MRVHLAGCLAIVLLVCLNPVLARSDWADDDSAATPIKPVLTPSDAKPSWRPSEAEEHLKTTKSPNLSSGRPLQGGVSQWDKVPPRSPRLSLSSTGLRDSLLENAPFLPPARERPISSGILKSWLQSSNPQFFERLSTTIKKNQIIEVKGSWDDSGHVLKAFGMPYTRIGSDSLAKMSFENVRVLIVNCGANLRSEALRVINKFVSEGGYLLTTDWALDCCLNPCFPGYVCWNGGYTEAQVVDAVVVYQDHALLKGVVSPAYWKLEQKSQLVRVLNPAQVNVLVRSRQLIQEDPSQQGVLAFSFTFGKGKVLHLVGHFDNNSSGAFNNLLPDPSPNIVVSLRQAIATNFIASAFAEPGLSISESN